MNGSDLLCSHVTTRSLFRLLGQVQSHKCSKKNQRKGSSMTYRCHTLGCNIGSTSRNNRTSSMKKVESSAHIADIPEGNFHIDVSRLEPYVVHAECSFEIPLMTLSHLELTHLRDSAARQLLRNVHDDHEVVDEHRATLFYLSRWADRPEVSKKESADRRATPRRQPLNTNPFSRQSA